MIIRIETENGHVGYVLMPDAAAEIDAERTVFHIRDRHGNGPDLTGRTVGRTIGEGVAVLMTAMASDHLMSMSQHAMDHKGRIIADWMETAFTEAEAVWANHMSLGSLST